jgi:hypothetical protein
MGSEAMPLMVIPSIFCSLSVGVAITRSRSNRRLDSYRIWRAAHDLVSRRAMGHRKMSRVRGLSRLIAGWAALQGCGAVGMKPDKPVELNRRATQTHCPSSRKLLRSAALRDIRRGK